MTFDELEASVTGVENDGKPSMRFLIEEFRGEGLEISLSYRFPVQGRAASPFSPRYRAYEEYVLVWTEDGRGQGDVVPYANVVGVSVRRRP